MKRLLLSLSLIFTVLFCSHVYAFRIEYDNQTHEYTGSVYTLQVNGRTLTLPMEPIVFNDRALVPVREVFEALGATVEYDPAYSCVNITYNGRKITLYINQTVAMIDGKPVNIPDNAVPKLINKPGSAAKTMVPVRFISESLGLNVIFNNPVINVTSQQTAYKNGGVIDNIEYYDSGNNTLTAHFMYNGNPGNVSGFILNNPTRLVIDVSNCAYTTESAYGVNISGVTKIRLGYENSRTRLVFDAANVSLAHIRVKNNIITVTIGTGGTPTTKVTTEFSETNAVDQALQAYMPSQPAPPAQQTPTTPTIQPNVSAGAKIIVVDAGHGGKDGGAQGTLNGNTVLEKTLTLQIAERTKNILANAGYMVQMTRETDTYPTLQERADFANSLNAAVFVSIHINSAESAPTASGTEVFYAPLNNDASYGLRSSDLASYIQNNLISALGSKNRGVKQSNHLVTRTALMPAALIEVGFISNEAELYNMTTDVYQQKAAEAIASGVIKALDSIYIPANVAELAEQRKQALIEWENS